MKSRYTVSLSSAFVFRTISMISPFLQSAYLTISTWRMEYVFPDRLPPWLMVIRFALSWFLRNTGETRHSADEATRPNNGPINGKQQASIREYNSTVRKVIKKGNPHGSPFLSSNKTNLSTGQLLRFRQLGLILLILPMTAHYP